MDQKIVNDEYLLNTDLKDDVRMATCILIHNILGTMQGTFMYYFL